MAVIHTATMTFARRLANVETIEQQDSAERALNKLARTFAMQMEALKRYRTGGGGTERLPHLVGRGRGSKSFSARATSMATLQNDTDTSTGHFQTPSWTASSTRSRAGSPLSTGAPSPRRSIRQP